MSDSGPDELNELEQLPVDSDVDEAPARQGEPPRPVHLRPLYLLLVIGGGTIGTAVRYLASISVAPAHAIWATLFVNIAGAFLLGVLLEALARRGPDRSERRVLRLLIGTGFMGGFTTYSTLAVQTQDQFVAGTPWAGIVYALISVVVGILAAGFGIWVATEHHRRTKLRTKRGGSR